MFFFSLLFYCIAVFQEELSHMDPLSSFSHSESVRIHLIMKVCGYSTIVLLHRPYRQHRVGLPTHQSKTRTHQRSQRWTLLSEQSTHIPKNNRSGGGVGMVVEAGVCTERHIFTHLWADCCCSWRGSQRCCWMPWHGSPSGAEPLASVRLRVVRGAEEKGRSQKQGERRRWELLELRDGAQPRIGLWPPQESRATRLHRARQPPGDISEKGEERKSSWEHSQR